MSELRPLESRPEAGANFAIMTGLMVLVAVLGIASHASAIQPQSDTSTAVRPNPDANRRSALTFKEIGLGEPVSKDGAKMMMIRGYQASDGVRLSVVSGEFESSSEANDYFEKEIGKALKVLKRGDKTDSSERVEGRRAEVELTTYTPTGSAPAVVWTAGSLFYEIVSPSMADNIKLEKLFTK